MSDLVKRLRSKYCCDTPNCNCDEAADEIDRLTAESERFKTGYQGACYACEPVGELNVRLTARVKELEKELEEIDSICVHSGGDIHGVHPSAWEVAFKQAQGVARAALTPARTDSRFNNAERIFGDD